MWVYDPPACAGVVSPHITYSQTTEKEKNMKASTATKPAEVNTQTVETYPMEVAKIGNDNGGKGRFVQFVANKKNVQYQVWMNNIKINKLGIAPGSVIFFEATSIARANAYDSVNKVEMLNEAGETYPAELQEGYTSEDGEYVKYASPLGMLDIGAKVVNIDNSNAKAVVPKKSFNPL